MRICLLLFVPFLSFSAASPGRRAERVSRARASALSSADVYYCCDCVSCISSWMRNLPFSIMYRRVSVCLRHIRRSLPRARSLHFFFPLILMSVSCARCCPALSMHLIECGCGCVGQIGGRMREKFALTSFSRLCIRTVGAGELSLGGRIDWSETCPYALKTN